MNKNNVIKKDGLFKKMKIVFLVFFFVLIIIILFLPFKQKVSDKIVKYYNKIQDETFEVKLSDFTNFDWDSVIIYANPTTNKDLKEYADLDYKKGLDLKSGMIFIRDNKIVYEEVFKSNYEEPDKFRIIPYQDVNYNIKVNKFKKEEAIFVGEKINFNGENRYILKPLNY